MKTSLQIKHKKGISSCIFQLCTGFMNSVSVASVRSAETNTNNLALLPPLCLGGGTNRQMMQLSLCGAALYTSEMITPLCNITLMSHKSKLHHLTARAFLLS